MTTANAFPAVPQSAEVTPTPDLKTELLRVLKLLQEYANTLPDPPSSDLPPVIVPTRMLVQR